MWFPDLVSLDWWPESNHTVFKIIQNDVILTLIIETKKKKVRLEYDCMTPSQMIKVLDSQFLSITIFPPITIASVTLSILCYFHLFLFKSLWTMMFSHKYVVNHIFFLWDLFGCTFRFIFKCSYWFDYDITCSMYCI